MSWDDFGLLPTGTSAPLCTMFELTGILGVLDFNELEPSVSVCFVSGGRLVNLYCELHFRSIQ